MRYQLVPKTLRGPVRNKLGASNFPHSIERETGDGTRLLCLLTAPETAADPIPFRAVERYVFAGLRRGGGGSE